MINFSICFSAYVSRHKTYVKAVLASALCLEERVEHDTRRANGLIWQSQFVACSDRSGRGLRRGISWMKGKHLTDIVKLTCLEQVSRSFK